MFTYGLFYLHDCLVLSFVSNVRLRYNMPLSDLPSQCVCGEKFTVGHALSCKKGGFVAQRHDGVRNLLTSFVSKVCTNVEVVPRLQPLDNERFNLRSAVTSSEARLDIKAGGFWSRGITAFFDVRATHAKFKEKGHGNGMSYLRITIACLRGSSSGIPFVLKIWPAKSQSPNHNHGKSYAVIRVLQGAIKVSNYIK